MSLAARLSSSLSLSSRVRRLPAVVGVAPLLAVLGVGCGDAAGAPEADAAPETTAEVAAEANQVRCEFNAYNCTVPNFEKVKNKDTNRKYNDFDKTYYWDLEDKPALKDGAGNVRGHVKGQARFNFGQRKKLGGVSHVYAWAVSLVEGGSASGWVREDSVHRVATIGKMPTATPGKPSGGYYETDWVVTGGDVDASGNLVLNAKYGNRKVNPNVTSGEAATDYLVRQWSPTTRTGYVNLLYNLPGTGGMTTDTLPMCVHFKRFKAVKEVELELYFYDSPYQSDLKLHFDYGEINGRRGWMTKEMMTPASEVAKLSPNHPCRSTPTPTPTPAPTPEPPTPPDPPPPPTPNLAVGVFDAAGCEGLAGWSQDPDEPTKAVAASLFFGAAGEAGTSVPLSADRERADLCAPLGSCGHAFSSLAPFSLFDGAAHEVHAYGYDSADGSPTELQASPKTLSCALPTVTGSRRWVASPDSFADWGFDTFFDHLPLPAQAADGLPEGAVFPAAPVLVRAADDASVYLVDGATKRHVTSVASAEAWHLDLGTVQIKEPSEVAAIATGPALPVRPMLVTDSQKRVCVVDTADTTPDVPAPMPIDPATEPTGDAGAAGGPPAGGSGGAATGAGAGGGAPSGEADAGHAGQGNAAGASAGSAAGASPSPGAGEADESAGAANAAAPQQEGGCAMGSVSEPAGAAHGWWWVALGAAVFGRGWRGKPAPLRANKQGKLLARWTPRAAFVTHPRVCYGHAASHRPG